MTDPPLTRKMMEYHDEGEHVFPEPDCPSCRADRLRDALARAAELVDSGLSDDLGGLAKAYLVGWAGAVEALAERPESEHDGGCSAGISKLPCKCSQRYRTEAITKFCDAMLGERDG